MLPKPYTQYTRKQMVLILISIALQTCCHLIPFEYVVTLSKGATLKEDQCCTEIFCTASGHGFEVFYSSTKTTKLKYWYFRKHEILSKLLTSFLGYRIMSNTALTSSRQQVKCSFLSSVIKKSL